MNSFKLLICLCLAISIKTYSQTIVFDNVYNDYSHFTIYSGFDSFNMVPYYSELYNNDYFYASEILDDGYLFTGVTDNYNLTPFDSLRRIEGFYLKTNLFGDTLWQRKFNIADYGFEELFDVLGLKDGNMFIIGDYGDSTIYNSSTIGKLLLKIDSEGNEIWHKTFDDFEEEYFIDILELNTNSYYLLSSNTLPNDSIKVCVTHIDSLGNQIWLKCYEDNVKIIARNLVKANDHIFISAISYNPNVDTQYLSFYKLDSLANKISYYEYSAPNSDLSSYSFGSIDYYEDENGLHILMVAREDNLITHQTKAIVFSLDSNGNEEWRKNKIIEEYDYSGFISVQVLENGNIIALGFTDNHDLFGNDISGGAPYLVLLDKQGNTIFEKEINTNIDDDTWTYGYTIKEAKDGGFLISGYKINNQIIDEDGVFLRNNGWVQKTDSCGYTVGDVPVPMLIIDSIIGKTVYITDQSQNYCTAALDWGDGTELQNYYAYENNEPLAEKHFSHTYSQTGDITIRTTALAGEEFREYEVQVLGLSNNSIETVIPAQAGISLFPNPANDYIIVQNPYSNVIASANCSNPADCFIVPHRNDALKMSIYTINGEAIPPLGASGLNSRLFQQKLDVSSLNNGVYFVRFEMDGVLVGTEKLVVAR